MPCPGISDFVGRHSWLWGPPVRWLLKGGGRFARRRVLDLGCRAGRMSALFALLGARVTGVELDGMPLDPARREVDRWGVADRVEFVSYDGDPRHLPGDDYDFIFTKSVLVMVPDLPGFLPPLARRLSPDGELLMVENLAGGPVRDLARRAVWRWRGWNIAHRFHGVDRRFLDGVRAALDDVEMKRYYGLVAAIRARRRPGGAS